jgi:hypothetical protein
VKSLNLVSSCGVQRAQLRFICSDMWRPYLTVIAKKGVPKKASGTIHVLDRFPIMTKMSKALDEVRAQESKALVAKGYKPVLHRLRCTSVTFAPLRRRARSVAEPWLLTRIRNDIAQAPAFGAPR